MSELPSWLDTVDPSLLWIGDLGLGGLKNEGGRLRSLNGTDKGVLLLPGF